MITPCWACAFTSLSYLWRLSDTANDACFATASCLVIFCGNNVMPRTHYLLGRVCSRTNHEVSLGCDIFAGKQLNAAFQRSRVGLSAWAVACVEHCVVERAVQQCLQQENQPVHAATTTCTHRTHLLFFGTH